MTTMEAAASEAGTGGKRQWRELWSFIVILIMVLAPLLAAYGIVEYLAWRIGETISPQQIAQWQNADRHRIWRGGDGRSYLTYKLARTLLLKPEVLALGHSRLTQLRAKQFAPYTFYNVGLTAWTLKQFHRFLVLTTSQGYAPRVLFLSFEYWMFSKEYDRYWDDRFYEQPPTHWEDLKVVIDNLVTDPGELFRGLPRTDQAKGIYAVLHGSGFRWDGSLQGPSPPAGVDHLKEGNDHISVGSAPVLVDEHMAPEEIKQFESLLAFAKAHQISIVGIEFPFYKRVLDGLNSDAWAGTWRKFRTPEWRRYVESKGMLFFDYADVPQFRDKPEHFTDSVHPDQVVEDWVMRQVLADPRVRALLPRIQVRS